jgi:hypothetical protein
MKREDYAGTSPLGAGFKSSASRSRLEFAQRKPVCTLFYDGVAPKETSMLDCALIAMIG